MGLIIRMTRDTEHYLPVAPAAGQVWSNKNGRRFTLVAPSGYGWACTFPAEHSATRMESGWLEMRSFAQLKLETA